jgi:Leucine-rich repeat (LRR) protein
MPFRWGIRRRWLRISMRTLLLIVLVLCAWLAYVSNRARKQEELVRRLVHEGRGVVGYHHQIDANGKSIRDAPLPGPAWLRSLIGDHAFLRLRIVALNTSIEEDLRLISQFPSIETLSLDEQVCDEEMKFVAPLRNLKKLVLSSPYLSDRGIKHLSNLHKLEELTLGHARLTDAGLKHLGGLKNLKELVLIQTQVTGDGVARLRKQIPQARIDPDTFPSVAQEREVVQQLIKTGARFEADKDGWITDVTFYGIDVADEQLTPLQSLARLNSLNILDTRVTHAGVERLLKAKPKLQVYPPFREPLAEERDAVAALNRIGARLNFDKEGHVIQVWSFDEDLDPELLSPFADLRYLKRLMLFSNDVGNTGWRFISKAEALENVDVLYAEVNDANVRQIRSLRNLKEFRANATDLSDDGLAILGEFPALERLELRRVAITGPGLASLKNVKRLLITFQSSAEFSDDGLAHVAELTQLRALALNYASITDEGVKHLRKLVNLENLYLDGSRITDAGLLKLAELPKVKALSLDDTEVTSEGVAEFKKLRPNCKVGR